MKNMQLGIKEKVAIVTGAGQGIGRAIALTLAAEGAAVIVADIDFQTAKETAKKAKSFTPDSFAVKTDVAKSKDLAKLVKATVDRLGRIDILVNNAGICPRTSFMEIAEKEWDRVLAVNLKSVFLLSQMVIPYMEKNKFGRIINISSGAGKIGGVKVGAHYSASKAGILCLTKTMALVGAKSGINVNAVCPGVIGTEMTTNISPKQISGYKKMIPLGTLGKAEDVANAVLFLASDLARYITGETTDVNGGFIMD